MTEFLLTFGARQRVFSLLLIVLFSLAAAFGATRLKIDTSYDSLISVNDPGFPAYEDAIDAFGSDNTSIVFLRAADMFTPERLVRVEELHYAMEEIDGVEKVESLFTATNIRDQGGDLSTGPLMEVAPESAEEAAEIRENALYSPLIRGNLVSADGTVVAINVTVKNVAGDPSFNRRVFADIERLIGAERDHFEEVFQIGPPRLNVEIESGLFADLQVLTPAAAIIVIGAIVMFLRTGIAAVLPLTTAGLSVLWTLGFMGVAGIPISLLTAILPALVVVIGSTEDTHMLASYLHGLPDESHSDRRAKAIRFMARHVGLPIFITSFTTVFGFLTNSISDIALIRNFAYATSFAMFANLVSTVLALSLMLSVAGPTRRRRLAGEGERPGGLIGMVMGLLEKASVEHERTVIWVTVVLMAGLAAAGTLISVSNDPLSYFKSATPIVTDARTLHDDLSGMQVFYLVVEAEPGHDFKDPGQLDKIARIAAFMKEQGVYDNVTSLVDHLSLVNREMHGGDPAFFKLPGSRSLVEQYLLLFQPTDVERFLGAGDAKVNLVVRHDMSDSAILNTHIGALEAKAREVFGESANFAFTGKNLMINRAAESLFSGQAQSLILLLVLIFVIMWFLYTSVMAGVLSLIPNLIPIIVMFGTMGLLGIPLNPGTAMVAVIAIGIAIDDTIHLLTAYNNEVRKDSDQVAAASRAVWQQAVPVISTSLSLAAGFLVLSFSTFEIVAQFGLLSALTMLVAVVADLLVTPIFLRRLRVVGIWDIVGLTVSQDVLLKSSLFADMSKFQVRKTILLSQLDGFDAAAEIIKQGTRGRDMFLILSGEVEIVHHDGVSEKRIAVRKTGEIFGEVGYFGETDRMATVRTMTDVQLLRFDAQKVAESLRLYPRIAAKVNRNISRILGQRLAETGALLVHAGVTDGAGGEA